MLIGICGFAGAGKDTVANILQLHMFKRESFARPVKDAVSVIFGWDRSRLEGITSEDRKWREEPDIFWTDKFGYSFSPRMALQRMGTEIGREQYHPNIWVDSLEKRLDPNGNQVVTDVRFPNEMQMLHDRGATIIRIKRGPDPAWYDMAVNLNLSDNPAPLLYKGNPVHESEWRWVDNPHIDMTIENDGSFEDLTIEVNSIIDKMITADWQKRMGVQPVEAAETDVFS